MATTARDLIKGALRLIGATSSGETPSAEEISDGLFALNSMIDSWSNEGLLIFSKIRDEFTLVVGTQSYTMGVGATFNSARPLKVENAYLEVQDSENYEIPMDILTKDQWADIMEKDTESSIPTKLYVDYTYPNATLYVWPKPNVANNLVLYSHKPLSTLSNASTELSLPPGYERALRYNLALELAPEFGREPSPLVMQVAMEAKGKIKITNSIPHFLEVDGELVAGTATFNYLTGE